MTTSFFRTKQFFYMNLMHIYMPCFLTPALILSSHVRLGPASGFFLSSKVSSVSLTANMCAACPSHLYGFCFSSASSRQTYMYHAWNKYTVQVLYSGIQNVTTVIINSGFSVTNVDIRHGFDLRKSPPFCSKEVCLCPRLKWPKLKCCSGLLWTCKKFRIS